ncbi:MAG: cation:proton antiporter [Deltaproteobacteria bacterium]|nr:cation:proton antiporter [Deltaproteobacteria bacterium]
MHDHLVNLLIFLSAAVVAVSLFRYLKIGAVLAYLFAGILIGPEVLMLIKNPETILNFSELGVVFLLFLIGLQLKPGRIWQMRMSIFGMGLMQVLVTGVLLSVITFYVFSMSKSASFIIGFGIALSSTPFGLQILQERRQLQTTHGQGTFAILLFQDLAFVPLLAILPILGNGGFASMPTWIELVKVIVILTLFVLVGLYFIHHFFYIIAESRVQEVFTASALLIVIGSALLMEYLGFSMGIGAFFAGILLANSEYRHELEVNLKPFNGLLMGLFFMAIGMSLNLKILLAVPQIVFLIVLSFMFIKAAVVFILARFFKYPHEAARNMAFTLSQGGEFAFLLFHNALSLNVFSDYQTAILNASVTLSMVMTPLLFNLNQKYFRTYREVSEKPIEEIPLDDVQVIIAGYGRFGQIISRLLRAENISFTILEHSAAQVDTARKFGTKIYYGDASKKDIVEVAGAKEAKIFVLAIDDYKNSVKTAKMLRQHFPHLRIVARARNRRHAMELMALGIEKIHRETYLTSLEVSKEVLLDLGIEKSEVESLLKRFQKYDEKILKRQTSFKDDQKKYVTFTSRANRDLEDILQADQNFDIEDLEDTEL